MTTRIQNLSDLQDRRIMMEKKLPAFGYALILLVAFLMVFLVIWSTQNKRTYVSQSTGSVQAANKTYIMSSYSGSITELNISEGSYVTEGDLIAHIKSTDLDIQQDSYQKQLDIYKSRRASTKSCSSPFRTTRTTSARPTSTISPITTSTRATRARSARRRLTLRPIRPPVTPMSRSRP